MLTAQRVAPAVFHMHQAPDSFKTTIVAAIMYLGAFVIIVSAGLCMIGNRLPRLRDLLHDDDDQGEEDTHVIPASPLFVPGHQGRQ